MKLLSLILLVSTCYPAAGLQLRVLHSFWPHVTAVSPFSACILADPNLLQKLPSDIAHQILLQAQLDASPKQVQTHNLSASARKLFTQHLPTETLKAGICSTQIAYGFSFRKLPQYIEMSTRTLDPKFNWQSESLRCLQYSNPRLFLTIPADDEDDQQIRQEYDLQDFIEEPHIKMLEQKGETQLVEELLSERVSEVKQDSKLIACLTIPNQCCSTDKENEAILYSVIKKIQGTIA